MKKFCLALSTLVWSLCSLSAGAQISPDPSLVWEGKSLLLKSPAGKVLAEYSSHLGKPEYWVDARPQKILLFFKSYQRIELLDHKLNRIGDAIFLPDVGIYKSHLVCPSVENGVWVYDQTQRKIHFVDFRLKKTTSSLELSSVLANLSDHPNEMKEIGGRLYLYYPQITLILDKYGSLVKVIQNKIQK